MTSSPLHIPIRPEWLDSQKEAPLDAAIPVIDSHHHLYDRPGVRYLLEEYLKDINGGHHVRATVFVQARAMLRSDVAVHLQPLGETEFANGVAAMSASGLYGNARVCAGIVGQADLTLGDAIRPVLEKHIAIAGGPVAEGGRFRGIRQTLAWDADASLTNSAYPTSQFMMESPEFRAGFAHLAPLNLSFEGWLFFHQLPQLAALARAFPSTPIVLNHCGGIVRIAGYAGRDDEVFRQWKDGLMQLARCPNVMIKLSGLGMRLGGFGFEEQSQAPTSQQLATAWRPWIETCIEAFGSDRCMYGSNFPVDKGSYDYGVGLNALKRLTEQASQAEKNDIFWRTAMRFYRLPAFDLSGSNHL
ncbi:amidohydrolase [Candidimonas sp. SYP-B2681]|uniref:amidohydrolase family protein n=1 Tax=Candidimonas sp. SYP-B2681 TaxID=2497686 RepID=UPI000F863CB8|nr:amidohydrolase family protein [Candidimonas sp. SYP-B2681]RTZ41704.1 amidohydrolase [Candidimonas sp. SYP-B2681]